MYYSSLASDSLVDILRLIRTPNVGPVTFFQLIMRYGTAAEALAALPNLSIRGGRKQAVKSPSKSEIDQEIDRVEKFGARFVRYGEADYPPLLNYISDAPPVLCIKGNASAYKDHPLVAMVGSRNASANACQFAQKLAREVGASGINVVSGLARGIDSYAHKGSLSQGTIAVIAGGIDNIYPPENAVLYEEIQQNGVIISEQPFGQIPFAGAFPSRNRIIAGMSHATLVVEASPKSGSLITARLALEYNRELMAVPGSPLDPRAKGCNQLIKQGAHVAEEAADIVQLVQSGKLQLSLNETAGSSFTSAAVNESEVAAAHTVLMEKLGPSAVAIDELVEQCQLSVAVAQAALLELELAGKIRRVVGGKVALVYEDSDAQGAA
ncbi:MAG: DNA-processing protein DprA [Alphaproteobacteria bacterium]|nr:DNA-processing protein DprA [Alphaproteobacteria bacterium]